jgi:hypothetical protein
MVKSAFTSRQNEGNDPMIRLIATALLALPLWPAMLAAQEKVTVPLSDSSQPATLRVRLITGSITVTAGTGPQVVVESSAASRRPARAVPPGMHRLDNDGLSVDEDHNTVTVRPSSPGDRTDLTIQVPVNTSLELHTINSGRIDVTGVNGDLEIHNINGSVNVTGVSGSVVAHSLNGNLTVLMTRVAQGMPMSLTSLNGKIDVTLPADTKAHLRIKAPRGSTSSDFNLESTRTREGRTEGNINGGGPDFAFETMNGDVAVHRK